MFTGRLEFDLRCFVFLYIALYLYVTLLAKFCFLIFVFQMSSSNQLSSPPSTDY